MEKMTGKRDLREDLRKEAIDAVKHDEIDNFVSIVKYLKATAKSEEEMKEFSSVLEIIFLYDESKRYVFGSLYDHIVHSNKNGDLENSDNEMLNNLLIAIKEDDLEKYLELSKCLIETATSVDEINQISLQIYLAIADKSKNIRNAYTQHLNNLKKLSPYCNEILSNDTKLSK